MAINIFSGGSNAKKSSPNRAKASERAARAKAALAAPAQTSDSGGTAVGTNGTLSKVGNFVGKAANIASKFLPGIGGTIAKGLANVFNDPEWWQSVPGDAVTLNTPLRYTELSLPSGGSKLRPALVEFASAVGAGTKLDDAPIMRPTEAMVTQYLMPQIRKVVNAIPLQSAEAYKRVLANNAACYATWRCLLKYDYMLKHGQTYLASFDDPMFPILQVKNAATLQSLIGRLEEYLRASVRLPHTLCEYLAWRYGRVYKSTNSAKAALVLYNVFELGTSMTQLQNYINEMVTFSSTSFDLQQANTDLYNAYYDHDMAVVIRDDTQFSYDAKEFLLRTNADLAASTLTRGDDPNAVYIDSTLDNPTTFMASTVSTLGVDTAGVACVLFPVYKANFFMPTPASLYQLDTGGIDRNTRWAMYIGQDTDAMPYGWLTITDSQWSRLPLVSGQVNPEVTSFATYGVNALTAAAACKACDVYNKDLYVAFTAYAANSPGATPQVAKAVFVDITSLSMDMGLVPDAIIGNEQVYAFANLVDNERKTSTSYAKAEKAIARDTANFVETLDVAEAASGK